MLCILRAVVGLNNTLAISAPLISDYVKQESRGRAVTINTLAIGLSQVFATQFLVPMTQGMNFEQSFTVSSLMMLALTLPVLFMIREPNPKEKKDRADASLQNLAINEARSDDRNVREL